MDLIDNVYSMGYCQPTEVGLKTTIRLDWFNMQSMFGLAQYAKPDKEINFACIPLHAKRAA